MTSNNNSNTKEHVHDISHAQICNFHSYTTFSSYRHFLYFSNDHINSSGGGDTSPHPLSIDLDELLPLYTLMATGNSWQQILESMFQVSSHTQHTGPVINHLVLAFDVRYNSIRLLYKYDATL